MSKHKSRRSKLANYQELRYLAQNEAASCTLNLQLQTLTQSGLDQVIKRAFGTQQKGEATK
jgi:ribosomal protein L28